MAKSTKDRNRRAVIEQVRREQQRRERRRTVIVVSVCAVVALVIVGLAAVPLLKQHNLTRGPLAKLGPSTEAAGCGKITTRKANGNQEHKPVGTQIDYEGDPPAFGPHWPTPAPFARKYYTAADRPQLEYLVHNLEHGYSLLWYDSKVAGNKDQLAVVKAIADKFQGQKLTDKFIAVPWTSKDGPAFPAGKHVALTHWSAGRDPSDIKKQKGIWQYCEKPSGEVVSDFTKQYPYSDSPEPQGA